MQWILPAMGLALLSSAAMAQDNPIVPGDPQGLNPRYNVTNMNFDMWCQEEQHLPPERCDKRLPADDAAFNTYRSKIERFEIPYLKEQQRQERLNLGILHNDPVDHPDQPAQSQTPPTLTATPPQK